MTKTSPPKKPRAPAVKGGNRDPATGRLLPNHKLPGPGRPALPRWFTETTDEDLRRLKEMSKGTMTIIIKRKKVVVPVAPELALRALETCIAYKHGKPGKARLETDAAPTSDADRIRDLETLLFGQAVGGDVVATLKMLAALDPSRYGSLVIEPEDPNKVDTLDVVPILPSEAKPAAPSPTAPTPEEP